MSGVQFLWRVYRVVVFPVLYSFAGGGHHVGCKHQPSCSVYAVRVIERDGWVRGIWSAIKRVARCNPWTD